jgi:hypothetical protein
LVAAILALAGTAMGASHGSGGASASDAAHYAGDSKHLGDRWLRQGMTGHDVRVLQQFLGFAGFPTHITGTFDRSTTRSVVAFERKHNLTSDGIVSADVASNLRKAVAAAENANRPHGTTRINGDGTATAPAGAPRQVLAAVSAANSIIHTSYCYAGGHGSWKSSCYDCSGSVGFALHAAGLLSSPAPSGDFESWGQPGPGRWITIYTNPNHIWMVVAGRAFDTADFGGPNIPDGSGPRWRSNPTGNMSDGGNYTVRHPAGL